MIYVIRHVRFVQQAQEHGEVLVSQVDGRINPTDGLTKWLAKDTKKRDFAFLMGFPELAYKVWILSNVFRQFKPRKIVPPAKQAIEVSTENLNTSSATLRVTEATPVEAVASAADVQPPAAPELAPIVPVDVPPSFLARIAARAYDGVRKAPMIADSASCFTVMDNETYAKEFGYAHYLTAPRRFILDCTQRSLTVSDIDLMVSQAVEVITHQLRVKDVVFDPSQLWTGFHVPPHNSVPWLHMHVLYPKSIVTAPPIAQRWTMPRFMAAADVKLAIVKINS